MSEVECPVLDALCEAEFDGVSNLVDSVVLVVLGEAEMKGLDEVEAEADED